MVDAEDKLIHDCSELLLWWCDKASSSGLVFVRALRGDVPCLPTRMAFPFLDWNLRFAAGSRCVAQCSTVGTFSVPDVPGGRGRARLLAWAGPLCSTSSLLTLIATNVESEHESQLLFLI